jgi:O-acetylserine/cysteine efflux transporter
MASTLKCNGDNVFLAHAVGAALTDLSVEGAMRWQHVALGILATAVWGFNFVVLKVALVDLPPLLLTAIRFILSCLPVLFLPRPEGMRLRDLLIVGATSFLGQYIFLFVAMAQGMPAGLSSVTLQLQVFITILFSILFLGERPKLQQYIGGAVALAGLATIASTVGAGTSIPVIAMVFCVLSSTIWAYGNFTVRQAGPAAGFGTLAGVCWASLVPPIPALALAFGFEGPERIFAALSNLHLITVAAVLYTVVLSTWLCFAIWGRLLSIYPAGTAAPFALLVPVFGGLSGYLVLDETLTPLRLVGSLMIFAGLAIILLPWNKVWRSAPGAP